MAKWLTGLLAFVLISSVVSKSYAAVWHIVYPRAEKQTQVLSEYPVMLLTLALDHTGVRYSLSPSDRVMQQGKALRQLQENREINLLWGQTSKEWEKDFLPIRIPILKGLTGWRLLLVKHDKLADFAALKHINQLLRYAPVQGADWPDTTILQASGFSLVTSQDKAELFDLVRLNQADFFPRSVLEIWQEMSNSQLTEGLSIEPNLALRYPVAFYFFVNKSNLVLARLISEGLERAIADGSFDQLFNDKFAAFLKEARIEQRHVFEFDNQLLTEQTPLTRQALWYQPNKSL